jgi:hypothetical protein
MAIPGIAACEPRSRLSGLERQPERRRIGGIDDLARMSYVIFQNYEQRAS